MPEYLQPLAQHRYHPERLLLRSAGGRSFVWFGEDPRALPEEIEPATAAWMLEQGTLRPLSLPVWVHVGDLPVKPTPTRTTT